MDYVIARTHVIDHERFLEAGSAARDLWLWGMLYAGKHETDGEIPMAAVMASPWGAGGKANVRLAAKLVEVGLWERTEKGFLVLKWTEMGNKTKAQIEEARKKWRKKKRGQRAEEKEPGPQECPRGTPQGSPSSVLNSPSYSPSLGSSSGSDPDLPHRSPRPTAAPVSTSSLPNGPPWFRRGSTAEKALEVFADAITDVTGEPFIVGPAMWLRDDMCTLLNKRGPKTSYVDALTWLGDMTQEWVRADPDCTDRKPSKLTSWLNDGKRVRGASKRGAEITKQPFDPSAPWMDLGDTGS